MYLVYMYFPSLCPVCFNSICVSFPQLHFDPTSCLWSKVALLCLFSSWTALLFAHPLTLKSKPFILDQNFLKRGEWSLIHWRKKTKTILVFQPLIWHMLDMLRPSTLQFHRNTQPTIWFMIGSHWNLNEENWWLNSAVLWSNYTKVRTNVACYKL